MRASGVITFLSLALCGATSRAEPCFVPLHSGTAVITPSDGVVGAPTNTTPIVRVDAADTVVELRTASGETVQSHSTRFNVESGFGPVVFERVIPDAPLPAGSTFVVVLDELEVSTFAVGDLRDDTAPDDPTTTPTGPYAGGSCTPFSTLEVEGDDDSTLFIASADAPSLAEGSTLSGLSTTAELLVAGDEGATEEVRVAAVDLAGNVSGADAVDVTFPSAADQGLGAWCASTEGSFPLAGVLVLAALLPGRRRFSAR